MRLNVRLNIILLLSLFVQHVQGPPSSDCIHFNGPVKLRENSSQCIRVMHSNEHTEEIFITYLFSETIYSIDEYYDFYQPTLTGSLCECSCRVQGGQCSGKTNKLNDECKKENISAGFCVPYVEPDTNSSLCGSSSSSHMICCQIRISSNKQTHSKLMAMKLLPPNSFYSLRICSQGFGHSDCRVLRVPEAANEIFYNGKLWKFEGDISLELPDRVWLYALQSKGIFITEHINDLDETDLTKIGWLKSTTRLRGDQLRGHLQLKPGNCNKIFDVKEITFVDAVVSQFPGEVFSNDSSKIQSLTWSDKKVCIQYSTGKPLQLQVVASKKFSAYINEEESRLEICINASSIHQNKNITLGIHDDDLNIIEDDIRVALSENGEGCKFLSQKFRKPVWVSLKVGPENSPGLYVFPEYRNGSNSSVAEEDERHSTANATIIVVPVLVIVIVAIFALIYSKRKKLAGILQCRNEDIEDQIPLIDLSVLPKIQESLKEKYKRSVSVRSPWELESITLDDVGINLNPLLKSSDGNRVLRHDELFSNSSFQDQECEKRTIFKYVVTGVSGVGKTKLSLRYLSDWVKKKRYLKEFSLVLYLNHCYDCQTLEDALKKVLKSLLNEDSSESNIENLIKDYQILVIYEMSRWRNIREMNFCSSLLRDKRLYETTLLVTVSSGENFWAEEVLREDLKGVEIQSVKRIRSPNLLCFRQHSKEISLSSRLRDLTGKVCSDPSRKELIESYLQGLIKEKIDDKIDLSSIAKENTGKHNISTFSKKIYDSWKRRNFMGLFREKDLKDFTSEIERFLVKTFIRSNIVSYNARNPLQEFCHGDFLDYFLAYHLWVLNEEKSEEFEQEILFLLKEGFRPSLSNNVYYFLIEKGLTQFAKEFFHKALSYYRFQYCINRVDRYDNELFAPIKDIISKGKTSDFIPPRWELQKPVDEKFKEFEYLKEGVQKKLIQVIRGNLRHLRHFSVSHHQVHAFELAFDCDEKTKPFIENSIRCQRLICLIKKINPEDTLEWIINILASIETACFEFIIEDINIQQLSNFIKEFEEKIPNKRISFLKCSLTNVKTEDIEAVRSVLSRKIEQVLINRESISSDDTEALESVFFSAFRNESLKAFSTLFYKGKRIRLKLEQDDFTKEWSFLAVGPDVKFVLPESSQVSCKEIEFDVTFNRNNKDANYARDLVGKITGLYKLTCISSFLKFLSNSKVCYDIKKLHIKFHYRYHQVGELEQLEKFLSLYHLCFSFPWDYIGESRINESDLKFIIAWLRSKSENKILEVKIRNFEFEANFLRDLLTSFNKIDELCQPLCLLKTISFDPLSDEYFSSILELCASLLRMGRLKKVKLCYPYKEQTQLLDQFFRTEENGKRFHVFFELYGNDNEQNSFQIDPEEEFKECISITWSEQDESERQLDES